MNSIECPECGDKWLNGLTCKVHFHQMLFWELDEGLWDVHHLMVLCYQLQHPSLCSQEALHWFIELLVKFVHQDMNPQQVREQISDSMDSQTRTFKVTGTPEKHAGYKHHFTWSMYASDIVQGEIADYYVNVQHWSETILDDLEESGNL